MDARLETEVMLADAWHIARSVLLARVREPVPAAVVGAFEIMLARRLRREPLAYILGYREFYGRRFKVTPAVLIPRPESELLVEGALRWLERNPRGLAVDVGAGAGAIGLSVLAERQGAGLLAVDISPAALAVCVENAAVLGVRERADFVVGDLATALPLVSAPVVLVANLPYVAAGDFASLEAEVRDYEPRGALAGGEDGLDVIRRMVEDLPRILKPSDEAVLEVGLGQAQAVMEMVSGAGLRSSVFPDLAGIPRMVTIQRGASTRNSRDHG